MWWWSCCYCGFCGQAKSQTLHMTIALAALSIKTLQLRSNIGNCSLSLAPRKPRASQVDPNAISSGASEVDPNAISLPPGHGNPKPRIRRHTEDSAANSDPTTLQNPGTLKSWSITTMFLLFGRGIVLCCVVGTPNHSFKM